ncbi:MAG: HAMP domain-containing sensor histidine kinase [Pseudomonadota bacterium]
MSDREPQSLDTRLAANRKRAEQRRDLARAVREARDRLSSSSGTNITFDYELTFTYARNRLSTVFILPALTLLIAAGAALLSDPQSAGLWFAGVMIAHILAIIGCRRFLEIPEPEVDLKSWRRRFIVSEFVFGLSWIGMFVLPFSNDVAFQVFQFSASLIAIGMLTMQTSNLDKASLVSTAPITIGLVASLIMDQSLISYLMATIAMAAQLLFFLLGQRLYASSLAIIAYRAEKDLLIAELEHAQAISEDSRRRAEEANVAKSRFLATISHELRTPLNAILGFSEVIKDEILGPLHNDTYKEYIRDIHGSGTHLLNLINEILDLSRIEAGRYTMDEAPVVLVYVIDECVGLMSLKAKNKEIRIHTHLDPDLPRLWADERSIRQIVLNLLSNAIKFTPTGGEVTIKAGWTAGGGQYVSVKDNGPGIAEEEIPIVLSAFGQGAIAIKSAEEGTGLGLPIVQAIVDMHGGRFDLRSKLREGTEAIATFPATRVLEAMPPIEKDQQPPAVRKAG